VRLAQVNPPRSSASLFQPATTVWRRASVYKLKPVPTPPVNVAEITGCTCKLDRNFSPGRRHGAFRARSLVEKLSRNAAHALG